MRRDDELMRQTSLADDRYQQLFDDLYHMGRPHDVFVESRGRGVRRKSARSLATLAPTSRWRRLSKAIRR